GRPLPVAGVQATRSYLVAQTARRKRRLINGYHDQPVRSRAAPKQCPRTGCRRGIRIPPRACSGRCSTGYLLRYLSERMAAGRLRQMHPVLAVQLLAGLILTHELTLPLAALVGFTATREQVVAQVADAWLRTMVLEPDV